jgi:hypothetical protein
VHVELASRVAMDLGGAIPFTVDMNDFAPRPSEALAPMQRANEIVLQIGMAEAFAAGTGAGNRNAASHPLPRAVFDRILADESRHRRFSALYFEWAGERLDDAERARLAGVATRVMGTLSTFWRVTPTPIVDGKTKDGWRLEDLHALGWLESAKMTVLARDVVRRHVLAPLDDLGIVVPRDERERLLAEA